MISSRFQSAPPAQLTKRPRKLPKTPAILANARGTSTMSAISSERKAAIASPGIWDTNPISDPRAPWNQAHARCSALACFMFSHTSSWPISFRKPPIKVSALRGTGSPVIGFRPRTAVSRSQPRVCDARRASGIRIASLTKRMMSATRPFAKLMMRVMGAVKIALARSQTPPRSKTSDHLSVPRKLVTAALIALPTRPSEAICCEIQLPTRSKMPELSSAWTIKFPPGRNSTSARRMLAGLRSTALMLIGFTPRMMVNIRKPGMLSAWRAK